MATNQNNAANFLYADWTAPAQSAAAVTSADGSDLPGGATRGLWIGTAGNLVVDMVSGDTSVTFSNVPVGILPLQVKRVRATGTTASNIVALY